MAIAKRSIGLWCGALGLFAATSGASCSSNDRPPPSGFGNVVTGGASGESGGYQPPPLNRGGKSGKGGTSSGATSGASGDNPGFGGDNPGGAGSGEGGQRGGTGGKGGGGGAGNLGARGGGGNETAEGGALLTGPDDCPPLTPINGSVAPVCDPKASWGTGMQVLATPSGADDLFAITPDELTVAWRYAGEVAGPNLYVADRQGPDDEFATPDPIMDPAAVGATKVAIDPGRLRLVVVVNGQLLEFVRTTTTDPFSYAGTGHFAAIDIDASERAGMLADPVLAGGGSTLYYTLASAELSGPTLYVAHRLANDDFALGKPIDECNLQRASSGVRRPTGISADERTLFYYDEPLAVQRAAWRPAPDRPFDTFIDLPNLSSVQPSAACDRIYYSTHTANGLEIDAADEK